MILIIKRGKQSWQDQAEVACALGLAYGKLGDFEKAIGHLDKALKARKAELRIRAAVEQIERSFRRSSWRRSIPGATGQKQCS